MNGLRVFLALLVVDWILGIPGVGLETRTYSSDVMNAVYSVVSLAVLVALVLTWRGRRFAAPVSLAVGAAAVILAMLDIFGLSGAEPAPAAIVVVDLAGIAIGAGIVWMALQVRKAVALPA